MGETMPPYFSSIEFFGFNKNLSTSFPGSLHRLQLSLSFVLVMGCGSGLSKGEYGQWRARG